MKYFFCLQIDQTKSILYISSNWIKYELTIEIKYSINRFVFQWNLQNKSIMNSKFTSN